MASTGFGICPRHRGSPPPPIGIHGESPRSRHLFPVNTSAPDSPSPGLPHHPEESLQSHGEAGAEGPPSPTMAATPRHRGIIFTGSHPAIVQSGGAGLTGFQILMSLALPVPDYHSSPYGGECRAPIRSPRRIPSNTHPGLWVPADPRAAFFDWGSLRVVGSGCPPHTPQRP
jgi:hypothetical protein